MEVYSIIDDLEDPSNKGQTLLIQQAFVRNRTLLRKYSPHFKNTNQTLFLRKVRTHIKQNRSSIKSTLFLHRYSYPQISSNARTTANQNNQEVKISTDRHNSSCKSFQKLSTFKSSSNIPKAPQSLKKFLRETKRSWESRDKSKIKIVSLGENIQMSEEKIKSCISNRYKMTLLRLKNWYNNAKAIQTPIRPSYFVKFSLRETLNKKMGKN